MPAESERILVGRLGAAHGVRGELRIHSFTDPPENLLGYEQLWLQSAGRASSWQPVRILAARQQGRTLLAQLEGVTDREQARALTGSELAVAVTALPPLEPDDYYWHQLIGLAVYTVSEQRLGRVERLIETGSNDVLVVRGDADSIDRRERLLPWLLEQVIREVDLERGQIVVDWDPEF